MKTSPRMFIISAIIYCFTLILSTSCSKERELYAHLEEVPTDASVDSVNSTNAEVTNTKNLNPDSLNTDSLNIEVSFDSIPLSYTNTTVSISGNQFFINGKPTYEGRYYKGNKIEGLLMNSRMVQGIFDDLNPTTKHHFKYSDTGSWDADRNTSEFIAAMTEWKENGLLAFTLNLQGGSPTGYGNAQAWINSAFNEKGDLRPSYMSRLKRVLDEANRLEMVVILGYFYFGQDELLENETAVINAVDNITNWILEKGYKNLLIEINNECDIYYDHSILKPERVDELIYRVKQTEKNGYRLLVSTSFRGTVVPKANVVMASDYILLHGNGVSKHSQLLKLIQDTRNVSGSDNKPIIINEDDHYNFDSEDNNFSAAIEEYASWGYFDYRKSGESYENGFQSIPVDWGINSTRKKDFFSKLKEVTGY
ncbi:MAG: hypothetical protein AB8B59_18535 [Maribacter sp.]